MMVNYLLSFERCRLSNVVADGWRVEEIVRRMCGYNEFNGGGGTPEVLTTAPVPDDEDNEDDDEADEEEDDDDRAAEASAETP